ncbi:hypothetical protein [Dyella sp. SG609]|uniref:hypothetical protein n=1 Tax=Dyella sp. SG609 TaxID=2587018 RepID=UPI0014485BB6|nr:hypothetical protein [Dyella sp. SG609]NKJ23278.1 hypothetical protein [Dyella sp. SG609]
MQIQDDTMDDRPPRLQVGGVYLQIAKHDCHACGQATPVYALLLVGPFVVEGEVDLAVELTDDSTATLPNPVRLPEAVAAFATQHSQGRFRTDFSRAEERPYWMNHCQHCDTKIGAWYVHNAGGPFFPLNESDFPSITAGRLEGAFVFDDPSLGASSAMDTWRHWFERQ